jgi:hypothetical protein
VDERVANGRKPQKQAIIARPDRHAPGKRILANRPLIGSQLCEVDCLKCSKPIEAPQSADTRATDAALPVKVHPDAVSRHSSPVCRILADRTPLHPPLTGGMIATVSPG